MPGGINTNSLSGTTNSNAYGCQESYRWGTEI